jgi:hypothetical protein
MRHRKFIKLIAALGSQPLARGVLEMLWDAAYDAGDDRLGGPGELEILAGWNGERGVLAGALVSSGFVDQVSPDDFRVHDLWDHAPDYVRKRRDRELSRKSRSRPQPASDRSVTGQIMDSDRSVTGTLSTSTSTSTSSVPRESTDHSPSVAAPARTNRKPDAAPTRDLLTEFDRLHRQHLGAPAVIANGKDAALIARLWRSPGERVKPLMAAFFASPDPFIRSAGYTVGVFVSQAAKLLAQSRPPARASPRLETVAEMRARMAAEDAATGTTTH